MTKNDYEIITYSAQDTGEIKTSYFNNDIWLTQRQMAQLFQTSKQNISNHINNIYKSNELNKNLTVKKNLTVENNSNNCISNYYNLDVIISVGFRVNSKKGVLFRQWANKVIKDKTLETYKNANCIKNTPIQNNIYIDYTDLVKRLDEFEQIRHRNNERLKIIIAQQNDRIALLENKLLNAKKVTALII